MVTDTATVVRWIEEIERDGRNLTTWETEFIDDMMAKIERFGDRAIFTAKQAEIVGRIHAERTP